MVGRSTPLYDEGLEEELEELEDEELEELEELEDEELELDEVAL